MKVHWAAYMTVLRSNGRQRGLRRQVRCRLPDFNASWVPLSKRRPADLWSSGDIMTIEPITRNGKPVPLVVDD